MMVIMNNIKLLPHFREYLVTIIMGDNKAWSATASYPMSGPIRECLRSKARAWALLRLAVGSPFTARMRSPTPSRPSRLMEPPWMMLRISIPRPSFTALTVIPVRWSEHTRISLSFRSLTEKKISQELLFFENLGKSLKRYIYIFVFCVWYVYLQELCLSSLGITNPSVFS